MNTINKMFPAKFRLVAGLIIGMMAVVWSPDLYSKLSEWFKGGQQNA